jgi:hypothetical protein
MRSFGRPPQTFGTCLHSRAKIDILDAVFQSVVCRCRNTGLRALYYTQLDRRLIEQGNQEEDLPEQTIPITCHVFSAESQFL